LLAGLQTTGDEQEKKLQDAFDSLEWALSLSNYRDDVASLQEMALTCGDLGDFYESRGQSSLDESRAIYYYTQAEHFAKRGADPGTRDEDADQVFIKQLWLYYSAWVKILGGQQPTNEEFDSLINLDMIAAPAGGVGRVHTRRRPFQPGIRFPRSRY
jgi:hypothetical protein